MRIRLNAAERALVVEVLRDQRGQATRRAAEVYGSPRGDSRAVDEAHDRLREVEAAMAWMEDHGQPDGDGRTWLVGGASLLEDTVRGVAEGAMTALVAALERYADRHGPWPGDGPGLLAAVDLARDALTTLVRFREVDDPPWDAPYIGR
jgi:hypothetical protein